MTPEQKRAQAIRLLIEAMLESRAAADSNPSGIYRDDRAVTIRDGSTPVASQPEALGSQLDIKPKPGLLPVRPIDKVTAAIRRWFTFRSSRGD